MAKSLSLAVAALLTAACLPCVQAAPLTVSSEKTVLFVSETVTAGGVVNVSAKSGPLTTSERGFGIDRLGSNGAVGVSPASLPAINLSGSFGTPTGRPTRGMVLDLANAKLKSSFPSMQSGLATYMKKYGMSSGWFNYKQEVQVDAGGFLETWTIYWDFFADQNGRGAYADAKLVPPDPKVLYVTYTPLKVDADLPQTWSYPDAGTVKYQLRDMQFQPLTDWVTVNTGGAYDSVQTEVENVDGGVTCLMDATNPGCTNGGIDVNRLLDSTGAVLAVVDYVRRVEPVWENQPDGTKTPKMSSKIDSREVTYNGCLETVFRNRGSYGYTLATNMGRYLAVSSGSPRVVGFQEVNEYVGTYLSPTQDYDYSLKIKRSDIPNLGPYAIDPVKSDKLMLVANIPGLISVAPVTIMNVPQTIVGSATGGIWQYGGRDDAYQVTWTLKCATDSDGYSIDTKIEATRHWNGWHPSAVLTSAVSDTGWSSVALSQFSSSRYIAYADMANGIVHLTDGSTSGYYDYRASGGSEGYSSDFICGHNMYSMQAPGNANYSCENKNITTYSCGPASKPAYVFQDDVFQYRLTEKTCTGSTYLRGFYMNSGAPVWQNYPLTESDPTTNAVWACWKETVQVEELGKMVDKEVDKCDYRIDKKTPYCGKCGDDSGVQP